MSPPLMRQFMGSDVEGNIQVLVTSAVRDKSDAFRIRDGIGKRLCEAAISRKLDDTKLPELIGTEPLRKIVEAFLCGFDHSGDVVLVVAVVIDLDVHVVPAVALYLVPTGHK